MAQKPKRVRAPDYTEEEINIIRSNFIKYNETLSAKHSNECTQRDKDKIYKSILFEVNAVGVTERSIQSIKDKWQALKKTVKEKVAKSARVHRKPIFSEKVIFIFFLKRVISWSPRAVISNIYVARYPPHA